MKKLLVAGMILCAAFCGLYAQELYILKIKVQLANVRSEPDMNAPVIKQLKSGMLLEASQKLGDGFEITVKDEQSELVYSVQISAPPIDSSGTEDIKKNLEPLDYGLVLGAGASLPLGGFNVFIEGRYHMGMAELEEKSGDYETLVTGAEKFLSKFRLMVFMLRIKF